jgi:CelD/BcsL family acetyltransferase involved in cellulose biosynthesis
VADPETPTPNASPPGKVTGERYVVSVDRGPAARLIDPLVSEWTALCAEGPCDEPFHSPAWVRAYLTAFAPGAGLTLVTVRRDGALRAVLPLIDRSIGIGPLRLGWLRTTANSHFPRFDVVHGAGDQDEVTRVLWTFLRGWPGWDLMQFESAPESSVTWQLLDLAGQAGHQVRHHRPDASPWVEVDRFPRGIDDIISSLPTKLRSQCRRSLKRLREAGEITFRIVDHHNPPGEIREAIDALYRQEAAGWKGEAGSAILSDPATKAFYDLIVADATTNGSLAICQLWCGDALVATKLELIHGETMYELKSSYDEAYSKASPGHLIKTYSLDAAPDLGVRVLDNCGRSDPHKLAWTDLARPFATCFVFNRTLRGRLACILLFRAGPVVRERLSRYPVPGFVKRLLG